MKILITGVTGYLGGKLARGLTEAGHQVVGTSRRPTGQSTPNVDRLYAWAPLDQPLPMDAIAGVDGIVHLLGEPVSGRWTAAKKQRLYDSRVESSKNIVRGIEASPHRPQVIVGGSGVGYYGHRDDDELPETEPAGNDFLGTLSRDWEGSITDASRLGIRTVLSRTGLVVGKGAPFLKPQLPLFKLSLGGRLGSGKQWWAWVHVDDFIAIIRFALENDNVRGPLNVVSPQAIRQRDFAKVFGRAIGRPAITWVPSIAIRTVLGEFSGELLTSKRVIPKAVLQAGYRFAYPSLEEALREALGRS